jgi:hypothetical protein
MMTLNDLCAQLLPPEERIRIGKTKAILVLPLPDRNPGKRPRDMPVPPPVAACRPRH